MPNRLNARLSGSRCAVLVISVLVFCACGRHLSRSRATARIQGSQEFDRPKTVSVRVGSALELGMFEPEYPALRSLGFITVGGSYHIDGIALKNVDVSLTPKGERESHHWEREGQGTVYWKVPIGNRQFGEVTGIRELGGGKARVEFTWCWIPNKNGDALATSVDWSNRLKNEYVTQSQQDYERQFERAKVDRLMKMQLDLNRQQSVSNLAKLQAYWVNGKKLDKSRIFKSTLEFWLYDDGWRPAPNGEESLREALQTAERSSR